MTAGVVRTKKTRLYFVDPTSMTSDADTSAGVIRYVSCATGVSGLGGPASQIDITCLDSDENEYVQGMASPGQVTVPFNAIPASGAHQALFAMKEAGTTVSWMLALSDAVVAGTVPVALDSEGRLISSGPTTAEFLGYVADVAVEVATNEIVRGTLTVQRSGPLTWDWPTATQA